MPSRPDVRAHLKQRGDDALHGTFLERGVAGNAGGEGLAGEDSGEQADGGAGIFGVEGAPTALQAAQAAAGDFDGGAVDLDIRAEGFHAAKRAVAIAGGGEIAEFAGAVGKGGQHGVAMRDGFVAGKFESTGESAGGMNGYVFHDGGSWKSLAREELEVARNGERGKKAASTSRDRNTEITEEGRTGKNAADCLYLGTVLLGKLTEMTEKESRWRSPYH